MIYRVAFYILQFSIIGILKVQIGIIENVCIII